MVIQERIAEAFMILEAFSFRGEIDYPVCDSAAGLVYNDNIL